MKQFFRRIMWERLNIFQKLMFTILSSCLVLMIAMLTLARWSYEQGFFDYTNALEQRRMELLTPRLIEVYEASGKDIYQMPKQHTAEILASFPGVDTPPATRTARLNHVDHETQEVLNQEIDDEEKNTMNAAHAAAEARSERDVAPLPRGPMPGLRRGPQAAMFDLQGKYLAGAMEVVTTKQFTVQVPLMYHDQTVAWLRSIPVRHFSETLTTQVSKRQMFRSYMVGLVSILLAIFMSLWLTRVLLKPIRRVAAAVHRLSAGDYEARMNDASHDELGELMRDVDHLSYTLQRAQSSRKKWMANISHDIRTPLTVMTGEIESIKDGIRPLNMERIDSIEQEVNYLRKFTDDIYELSLSDIGGLRYEFASTDVHEAMSYAVNAIRVRAEQAGLSLHYAGEPSSWVFGDQARLRQLFKNLLINSVSYTESPGIIHVFVTAQASTIRITVADTAPSVSLENCPHLFDPLYREDASRNRAQKSAGLGLAICKNIVEAHQGTIDARPSDLGGLNITIELPKTVHD